MANILIAEDDPDQRELLAEMLIDEGYIVDAVDNGRDARELLEAFHYDVGILDIRMPQLDGLTALKQLREHGSTIPIILLSDFASKEDVNGYIATGASAALSKPFDLDELLKLIANIIKAPPN